MFAEVGSSGKNTGAEATSDIDLILGIVIPVTAVLFILIGVAAVIIYKRYKYYIIPLSYISLR